MPLRPLQFQKVTEYLEDGSLSLSTLLESEVLDEEHVVEILERAAGKSEDQVKALVVELRPKAVQPDPLKKLPTPRNSSSGSGAELPAVAAPAPAEPSPAAVPVASPPVSRPAARVEPIAPDRHVMRVTVSGAS